MGGFTRVEVRLKFFQDSELCNCFLIISTGELDCFFPPLLDTGKVGEDELGINHLDIADRVDRTVDMVDIFIIETAHDLGNGMDFSDGGEELVAQPFALGRPFDQTGDIDKFNGRGDNLLRVLDFSKLLQTGIGHCDDPDIRVDRAKRVIGRLSFTRAGEGIK